MTRNAVKIIPRPNGGATSRSGVPGGNDGWATTDAQPAVSRHTTATDATLGAFIAKTLMTVLSVYVPVSD
jgi:hypothetical protein